jgi:hypothetical protein
MLAVQWSAAGVLLVGALWVIVVNWLCVVMHRSWVPLVGGLLGCLGLLVVPIASATAYWWVPFLVDFGSAPGLTLALVATVRRE